MDVLYKAASLFKELLDTEYVFVLGKRNVKATIHLIFRKSTRRFAQSTYYPSINRFDVSILAFFVLF